MEQKLSSCNTMLSFNSVFLGHGSVYFYPRISKYVTKWKVVQHISQQRRRRFWHISSRSWSFKVEKWWIGPKFRCISKLETIICQQSSNLIPNSNIDLQWSNRIKNEGDEMELSAKRAFWKVTQLKKMFLQWDENGNSGFSYYLVSFV